jgi:hypothetical protein
MSVTAHLRTVDAGGPVVIHEQDPPPACGRGVCVETVFDGDTNEATEIALSLRRTTRHDGGPADVDPTRAAVRVSLASGLYTRADAEADLLFTEHPWLRAELVSRLDWLRARASRHAAQRDRTTLVAALARAKPGDMVPHDKLFPADWDLLINHAGTIYWAVDYYCVKPACDCHHVYITLHDVTKFTAPKIGSLQLDITPNAAPPKASPPLAAALSAPFRAEHHTTLVARYAELRGALRARDELHRGELAVNPPRNARCACGSGKKYKRCCAEREVPAARAPASPTRSAR